jgi:hypothetical protein
MERKDKRSTHFQIRVALDEAWPRTYEELGIAVKSDPRDGLAVGGYTNLTTVDINSHTRSYAATAYYCLLQNARI